jgi:hypothetical protein
MGLRAIIHHWLLLALSTTRRWDWLACWGASSLVVGLSIAFAQRYVESTKPVDHRNFIDCMVHWDGAYYRDIARDGYSYKPGRQSTIHFWPLYPLVARGVMALTGLPAEYALVLVSHVCFAAAIFLLGRYIDLRIGLDAADVRSTALLALAFLPTGLFFHIAYTESLFFLLCLLELYLIERAAHPLAVTLVAGLAIVTRPPGVALLAPLAVYVWRRSSDRWRAAGWLCICLPLALSGLVEFLLYCEADFGDWFAPIRNRTALWAMRTMPSLDTRFLALVTLQPVWEIFLPDSPAYWGHYVPAHQFLFSIYPANPLYFVAACILLGIGVVRGWLNYTEILLTGFLLLIPYCKGYESCMLGMARYASAVPPLYLVLGRLLAQFSPGTIAAVAAFNSFYLAAYTGLFAQGYWII